MSDTMIRAKTRNSSVKPRFSTRKLVLTAMMSCLAFVLNTCVWFPAMAPFQHFVDVVAAVLLGPWYACAAAFVTGVLRMMTGRDIQAVAGAVFGPILGGWLYRKTGKLWLVWLGEVIGTGVCGAVTSYHLLRIFYGMDMQDWRYFIPFYTPSAVVGGLMGVAVVLLLTRMGLLRQMRERLLQEER